MDMQAELIRPGRFNDARPASSAPSADAPYEARSEWSRDYVTWFIAQKPQAGALPPDVRATHRFEVEFATCVADPETYERQTRAELPQLRVQR